MISEQEFLIIRLVSILIDVGLAGALLWGGRFIRLPCRVVDRQGAADPTHETELQQPRRISLPLFLITILVVCLEFTVKVFVALALGVWVFGLIHLAYDALFISMPIVAWALLVLSIRERSRSPKKLQLTKWVRVAALIIALVFPVVGWYATYVEPFRVQLEVHQVQINHWPAGNGPLRIGVLADIQTERVTDHERDAIDQLMVLKPDLILIPGDFFSGQDSNLAEHWDDLVDLLQRLHAPAGVYFVPGNSEELYDERALIEAGGVRYLRNEIVEVPFGDSLIRLAGLELKVEWDGALQTMREFDALPGADDLRILLSHRPDSILELQRAGLTRTDLVIAGHTHGGQVVVPFWGPLMTASEVPRHAAAGGLHELDGQQIYVSRGLGWEGGEAPRIRFCCPPEITLLVINN